ncbi:protein masquerade-like, partial [Pollicipes pollicipes]|uniref:protein masquerade-like n=1 Tax=Pollicipes pollicipes TaxID=41117 RepID=UPI001884D089
MDTDETELVDGLPRPQPYGAQQGTTICPGVCVAKRLAAYCEAALDLPGVCAADQRCCVAKDLFDGVEDKPEQFVILGKTPKPKPEEPEEEKKPASSAGIEIPEQKKCAGQCVTGLFSYLCDRVDSSVKCGNGGRCCLSRSRPDKTQATTAKPAGAPTEKCPGVCMPGLMKAYCNAPSRLLPNNRGCTSGQVCCDNREGADKQEAGAASPARPPRPPGASPIGAI